MITLSGFVDEALAPFPAQLAMARRAGLTQVELRRVGRTPLLQAHPALLAEVERLLTGRPLGVSCIASGIGKRPLTERLAPHLDALRHAAVLAHRFSTPYVRVFSWQTKRPDADRSEVLRRMEALGRVASDCHVTLLHENEKGVFGDTPERCLEVLDACGGTARQIFDPANFVQCGVRPLDAWSQLGGHVAELHAKDADARTRRVTPVGEGDAQWPELAAGLAASGWSGVVALEPHLGLGGRGGPVTPRRWTGALNTARSLLQEAGLTVR